LAWGPSDINSQDSLGLTPLHLAVKSAEDIKSTRMVRLLLIRGADRNIKDIYGRRAIDIA
jgi:ankyrin repeat protein